MLSLPEKVIFAVAVRVTVALAVRAIRRITGIIARGHGRPDWKLAVERLGDVLFRKTLSLLPTFRTRLLPSLFHGLVAWGFMFYLLVNFGDVLEGYISDFIFMGEGTLGGVYRLTADILSVAALVGMTIDSRHPHHA